MVFVVLVKLSSCTMSCTDCGPHCHSCCCYCYCATPDSLFVYESFSALQHHATVELKPDVDPACPHLIEHNNIYAKSLWNLARPIVHTIPCLSKRRESSSLIDFLDQNPSLDRSHLDQTQSFFDFHSISKLSETNHHLSCMQSSAGESDSTSGSSSEPPAAAAVPPAPS